MATISKPLRLKPTHIRPKRIAQIFRFPRLCAETPDELLFYVDTTITNKTQTKIPKLRKLTVENDDLDCCQNLLMNKMVVNNHIFQASKLKLQKYKRSHESARANGSHSNASIVPFAVDTLNYYLFKSNR